LAAAAEGAAAAGPGGGLEPAVRWGAARAAPELRLRRVAARGGPRVPEVLVEDDKAVGLREVFLETPVLGEKREELGRGAVEAELVRREARVVAKEGLEQPEPDALALAGLVDVKVQDAAGEGRGGAHGMRDGC